MYYLKGFKEVINIISDACQHSGNELSSLELRESYHGLLAKNSVIEIPITWNSIKILDLQGIRKYAPNYYLNKKSYFSDNSKQLQQRLMGSFFQDSLLVLQQQSKEIYDLANFLIKIVLVNQLKFYTEGTTEESIGFASMDFKDQFNQHDFIELIVHQLTHMITFLDDMTNPHMANDSKEIMLDTELKSKAGGNQFPAYTAFHSFIVGVEVLAFRDASTSLTFEGNYHGTTQRILRVGGHLEKTLAKNIYLFNQRAKDIFADAVKLLNSISQKYSGLEQRVVK